MFLPVSSLIGSLLHHRKSKVKPGMVELEEDVANEKNRIQEEERNGRKFILKTNELTKVLLWD